MDYKKNSNSKLAHFEYQPDFPDVDLSDSNADMLSYVLQRDAGLQTFTEQLQTHQRQLHIIADRALRTLGIKTRYAEEELFSFSNGFASFEAINDIVHPPRKYDMSPARKFVEDVLIDTRDMFDIELEELNAANLENREIIPVQRDRLSPDIDMANLHGFLAEKYPNTYGVILDIGKSRDETMAQLQVRTIGAEIAYDMQSRR